MGHARVGWGGSYKGRVGWDRVGHARVGVGWVINVTVADSLR